MSANTMQPNAYYMLAQNAIYIPKFSKVKYIFNYNSQQLSQNTELHQYIYKYKYYINISRPAHADDRLTEAKYQEI